MAGEPSSLGSSVVNWWKAPQIEGSRLKAGEEQHQKKELDKSQARRGGTLTGNLLQLCSICSIDACCIIVMVLKLDINKEL